MAGKVALIGAGQTAYGTSPLDLKGLFAHAVKAALESADKPLAVDRIEEAWIGCLGFGGSQLGNLAASLAVAAGLPAHLPAHHLESACASSGFALRNAVLAIQSGQVQVALAGGVEKMNDTGAEHRRYWLGVSGDTPWERLAGLTFPGVYALIARRHMHEYGTSKEALVACAVKNHAFAVHNPKAQLRKPLDPEKVRAAPPLAEPFTLYDCCPTSDGASAVLLASEEVAHQYTDSPIWVAGAGAATDSLALHERPSLTVFEATRRAAQAAYAQAGVKPNQVQVAEVHDCFTIAEILAVEDLGFCPKGEGGPFVLEGHTGRGGQLTVNPSGGLKAKGHPLGATGTGQIVELFHQLRGECPSQRQVPDAKVGLAHNVGGAGATCTVHLLRRD